MEAKKCNICKIRAYIKCDQCEQPIFFCSRGHLYSHKMKYHRAISSSKRANSNNITRTHNNMNFTNYNTKTNTNTNTYFSNSNTNGNIAEYIESNQNFQPQQKNPELDYRKLFEHLQDVKKEIITKMANHKFEEAIGQIQKSLSISRKFYQEDHPYNIELLFTISECYLNLSKLEEAKNNLETIIMLTDNIKEPNTNSIFRHKANMLLGAIALNLGEISTSLRCYVQCEEELPKICREPELNVKLSSVYLNLGICYIYLNNSNIAEKYLMKGLSQTEGILGNNTIHKLNADLFENLGCLYEQNNKYKESLVYYKKSLKLKFNLYGEKNDEVLELQYKISSAYLSLKQFKEAEEILSSMIELIIKQKMNYATQETLYRYAAYFYTYAVVLIKLNKNKMAKFYLAKSKEILDGFLVSEDPLFTNINNLMKVCDKISA